MPKLTVPKKKFTHGEVDPGLRMRSDLIGYQNGAAKMRNVIITPQGSAQRRPGQKYISTALNVDVRLAAFEFSEDQNYLFVFTDLKLQIYFEDVLQITLTTPYRFTDLNRITWAQRLDIMLVFHPDFHSQEIKRTGAHNSWTISNFAFKNIPQFDFGSSGGGVNELQEVHTAVFSAGETFKLELEGHRTGNIQWNASGSLTASRIQTQLRTLKNTSETGITVTSLTANDFEVTFAGDDGKRDWDEMLSTVTNAPTGPGTSWVTTPSPPGGKPDGEDVWSVTKGWPVTGVFFQNRLVIAGSKERPRTLWASKSGDVFDFSQALPDVDFGIETTADRDDVAEFVSIHAGRHLQVFAISSEFYVPATDSAAMTPENTFLRVNSSVGARRGVRAVEIDGATMFLQQDGAALREFLFTDGEVAYQTNNLALLWSHLLDRAIDMDMRRSTNTSKSDYVFLVNQNGTVVAFSTLRLEEVNGATLFVINGLYKSVAVLNTNERDHDVYFAVRHGDVTFIEKMDFSLLMDAGVSGTVITPTPIITGLGHLDGLSVAVCADGIYMGQFVPSGGSITLPRDIEESWQVGLKFPDVTDPGDPVPAEVWIKSLPTEEALPEKASTMGEFKNINEVNLRLASTSHILVQDEEQVFRDEGEDLLDAAPALFTGVLEVKGLLGWDEEGALELKQTIPAPMTVLGYVYEVTV